jgi:hypothetical protein
MVNSSEADSSKYFWGHREYMQFFFFKEAVHPLQTTYTTMDSRIITLSTSQNEQSFSRIKSWQNVPLTEQLWQRQGLTYKVTESSGSHHQWKAESLFTQLLIPAKKPKAMSSLQKIQK